MASLLQYLAEMTAHRDHSLLDVSVVSALRQLTQASDIRLLEIFPFRGSLYVRPKVWARAGKVCSADEVGESEQPKEELANYPLLSACIEQRRHHAETQRGEGAIVLWFPIWLNDKVSACLELHAPQPFSVEARSITEGILQVYRNHQNRRRGIRRAAAFRYAGQCAEDFRALPQTGRELSFSTGGQCDRQPWLCRDFKQYASSDSRTCGPGLVSCQDSRKKPGLLLRRSDQPGPAAIRNVP